MLPYLLNQIQKVISSSKVRIGIISTADIAVRHIIPSILQLSDHFELVGIAGRSISKTTALARQFATSGFDGYSSLINKSLVDAIYIPLPNALHYEWVEKALNEGLHVLVEKSLGCSFEEVAELNRLAQEKQLALVEYFQFRFHSQLFYIKKIAEEGRIGTLQCVRSSFGFPPFPNPENIRYKKELGGGALLDAGDYTLKISQQFLGPDIYVAAANLTIDNDKQVDISGGAYLKQKNGNLFGEVAFGFDHYYQNNIELWGSKGKITTNRIFTAPPGFLPEITIETNDGKEVLQLPSDNHFIKMLTHFYRLIKSGENRLEEYNQNVRQAALIEEFKKKANE